MLPPSPLPQSPFTQPADATATSVASGASAGLDAGSRADTSCFHCGQDASPDTPWQVTISGTLRPMCCAGCAAVAQTIVQAGGAGYYAQREGFGSKPDELPDTARLAALLDDPDWQSRHAAGRVQTSAHDVIMRVEGLRCGACAWLVERTLATEPGVKRASVNAATERIALAWDPDQTRLSQLAGKLQTIGYALVPIMERDPEKALRERRKAQRRLFVAGLGAAQVMMYAYPEYIEGADLDSDITLLMRWSSLLITLPVVLYSAVPFFDGARRSLAARAVGMDVAVSLGILIAFAASIFATVSNRGAVWYDSVSMFVFLLLAARQIDTGLRRKALAVRERIGAALPAAAEKLAGWPHSRDGVQVAPEALAPGDVVRVAAGETFPADVQLLEGQTDVDQSLLTGESIPVARQAGDQVAAGAINTAQAVIAQVTQAGAQATLAKLAQLADRSAAERPKIAQLADRIAGHFTLVLVLIAAATGLGWYWAGSDAWLAHMIAVLVVSCPCALSLATPAAFAAAAGRSLADGVVLANPDALDPLALATDVVFDKTGTLTLGRPQLTRTEGDPQLLAQAAWIAKDSRHPVSLAIVAAAKARGVPANPPEVLAQGVLVAPATRWQIEQRPGQGLRAQAIGTADGAPMMACWHLGHLNFALQALPMDRRATVAAALQACADQGASSFLVSQSGAWLALWLDDPLRPDAASALAQLHARGVRTWIFSGDTPARVQAIAKQLAIADEQALGGLSPDDKLQRLRALQQQGRTVVMVGDGLNDTPVLAGANVSLAVGEGAALAGAVADGVLLASAPSAVVRTQALAQRTRRVLRLNLAWAIGYNLIAIPVAAAGLLTPLLASIGMAASSILVVAHAARLLKAQHTAPSHPAPAAH